METVFDALKAMGKSHVGRTGCATDTVEEVLNELWELEKRLFVDKRYIWRVADNNVQQEQLEQAELPEENHHGNSRKNFGVRFNHDD